AGRLRDKRAETTHGCDSIARAAEARSTTMRFAPGCSPLRASRSASVAWESPEKRTSRSEKSRVVVDQRNACHAPAESAADSSMASAVRPSAAAAGCDRDARDGWV